MSTPSSSSASAQAIFRIGDEEQLLIGPDGGLWSIQEPVLVVIKRADERSNIEKQFISTWEKLQMFKWEYEKANNKCHEALVELEDERLEKEVIPTVRAEIQIKKNELLERHRLMVQMEPEYQEESNDPTKKPELRKELKKLNKEYAEVHRERKDLHRKIQEISAKIPDVRSKFEKQKEQSYELVEHLTFMDKEDFMDLEQLQNSSDFNDGIEKEENKKKAEHFKKVERISEKSRAIQELNAELQKIRDEIEKNVFVMDQRGKLYLTARIHNKKESIEAIKKENEGLAEKFRETELRFRRYNMDLNEYEEKKISHRNMAERIAGTVVNRQCQECTVEFQGPEKNNNSPRILLCGHTFCKTCVSKLIVKRRVKCPDCKRKDKLESTENTIINFEVIGMIP